MTAKLEFFYDYVSPYSYLANSQLGRFADAEVEYRPMLLGGVMKATGNQPPAMLPARGKYMSSDLARWVKHYDVPFAWNPGFPVLTIKALRVALVAQQRGEFKVVHDALYAGMWQQQADLSDEATLRGILDAAGVATDEYMQAIEADDIKEQLKANTEEAISRGAFGAPTMFVGDEMFFGNDRLHFVEAALASS